MDSNNRKYPFIAAIVFGLAGVASLIVTDYIFVPRVPNTPVTFYFTSQPMLIASVTLPPAIFAYFSCYRWLSKGSVFFKGWVNVALFSGFSLAINPIIWFMILMTFFFFGLAAFTTFILTGLMLKFILSKVEYKTNVNA